jgi:ribonuclease Z
MGIIFFIGGFSVHIYLAQPATDLHIYVKKGEIIKLQLRLSNSWTSYGLHFHVESNESQLIFEDDKVRVKQFL